MAEFQISKNWKQIPTLDTTLPIEAFRGSLLEELITRGVTIHIQLAEGEAQVTPVHFKLETYPSEKNENVVAWELIITSEHGEDIGFYKVDVELDTKKANLVHKAHYRSCPEKYRGKGIMALGFSLLAECLREKGIIQIVGHADPLNDESFYSRYKAFDFTNKHLFKNSTTVQPSAKRTDLEIVTRL